MHPETSTDFRYMRVIDFVSSTPWAIRASTLAVMVDVLRFRAGGERLTTESIRERIALSPGGAARENRRDAQAQAGGMPGSGTAIAVIPLHGVIAPRAAVFEETSSSGAGLDQFVALLRQAVGNPDVSGIMLDVDSPGGSVAGVPEAAAEILRARETKKVWATANTLAASAAYWLAAAAEQVFVSPSAMVGSIGVFSAHEDLSKALELEGVKVTLISAGKYKTEGNPFEPLTDEARAAIQESVDAYMTMFVDAVAKGRGVKAKDVRGGFGQGRVVTAEQAVALGMADKVMTLEQAIDRMLGRKAAPGPRAELAPPVATLADVLDSVRVEVDEAMLAEANRIATEPVAVHPDVRRRRLALYRH